MAAREAFISVLTLMVRTSVRPRVKTVLRHQGVRTREALQEAIGQALDLITAHDARGWFLHCGYPPPVLNETAQEL